MSPDAGHGEALTSAVSLVVSGGPVLTSTSHPEVIADGALAVAGDRIAAVGPECEILEMAGSVRRLDAAGGLIMPGLVNLHHHAYSALARGLDPGVPTRSFAEVLGGLWWRLDRALNAETVELSARLTAAECIRWGCTTVVDHHASPSCLSGSLGILEKAFADAGMRSVLCYEVSDRNGHDEALTGIDENLEFLKIHSDDPRCRGLVGLHASFTLSNQTLDEVALRRPHGVGIHIHLAEDAMDVDTSRERWGAEPLRRLDLRELLADDALLIHGVHLTPPDLALLAEREVVLVHNPESNAHNGVGRLDLVSASSAGIRLGLGTDGMSSNMLRSLRAAFLALRGGRLDPTAGFDVVPDLLNTNAEIAGRVFDEPQLGRLEPGAPADIVVLDAPPPTPFQADNAFGHLVYGAAEAPVRHTVAGGNVLLEDFHHTTLDPRELARQATEVSPDLWRRFAEIGVR